MHRYRCPDCNSKLDLDKINMRRYLAKCIKCNFVHIIQTDLVRKDEIYLKVLEDSDKGIIEKDIKFENLLEEEGILKSRTIIEKEIEDKGISFNKLPKPITESLLSKKDYPVLYRYFPAEVPVFCQTMKNIPISEELLRALKKGGVNQLYKFQEDSITNILEGKNIAIVAPTGTGKTESFALPIIHLISQNKNNSNGKKFGSVSSLFIYPTKSLARDQSPKIKMLASSVGVTIDIFDGDTSKDRKNRILEEHPDIIITNFDTLHHHLIHRTQFSKLISNIKYVVVDEVHVYTGTFGSNVHFILKRLKRICGDFQIIGSSATISNPKAFCEALFDRPISVIKCEKGKHGVIHLVMMYSSLRSHHSLTQDILKLVTTSGRKTIAFSNSHLSAELTAFYGKKNGISINVHRAGLLSKYRQKIEENFRNGNLKAISATPTLELGIDIGKIDTIISDLVSWTRLIQRTGRAGRRGQDSMVFVSLRKDDPISQYYKNNPEDYFKDIEPGYIDPFNPIISKFQLLASSIDKPIKENEFKKYQNIIKELIQTGHLKNGNNGLIPDYPIVRKLLRNYNLRGSGNIVSIMSQNKKIGVRDLPQALDELHVDAIYFLGGSRYKSNGLKFSIISNQAEVERLPNNFPYYTRPLKEEWPTIKKIFFKKKIMQTEIAYCELIIERKIIGYTKIKIDKESSKGEKILLDESIHYSFKTKGLIFKAPFPFKKNISSKNVMDIDTSSFHAVEHVIIEGTNMITGGSSSEMGGISLGNSGIIIIYDSSSGGNGASRILFNNLYKAFTRSLKILKDCKCTSEDGCPRCTYSYRCGNNNEFLSKSGATEVLSLILDNKESYLDLEINHEWHPLV